VWKLSHMAYVAYGGGSTVLITPVSLGSIPGEAEWHDRVSILWVYVNSYLHGNCLCMRIVPGVSLVTRSSYYYWRT
jgi:hypothetical protein